MAGAYGLDSSTVDLLHSWWLKQCSSYKFNFVAAMASQFRPLLPLHVDTHAADAFLSYIPCDFQCACMRHVAATTAAALPFCAHSRHDLFSVHWPRCPTISWFSRFAPFRVWSWDSCHADVSFVSPAWCPSPSFHTKSDKTRKGSNGEISCDKCDKLVHPICSV